VLFLVDEARMLGTMSQLEVVRDTLRKYEITLVLIYQSLGQLDDIWGRHARSKWLDSVSWVSYAAIGHLGTAEEISKTCGTYTVETTSRTISSSGRTSRTRSYGERALIMPQEVMQSMRADEQIVFVKGAAPIRCGRAIYFRRGDMKDLVGESRFLAASSAPQSEGRPPTISAA
jgi:type IV secretion system protein VirD4